MFEWVTRALLSENLRPSALTCPLCRHDVSGRRTAEYVYLIGPPDDKYLVDATLSQPRERDAAVIDLTKDQPFDVIDLTQEEPVEVIDLTQDD